MSSKQESLQALAEYLRPRYRIPDAGVKTEILDASNLNPVEWLRKFFPKYVSDPVGNFTDFADFHLELLDWIFSLQRGIALDPFVAIWARGSAKSSFAEFSCARINAMKTRKYIVYIAATQDRADDHLQNISSMLESKVYGKYYPDAASRRLSKYGSSKGWRRNRLMTGSGLTIDALGLDVSVRGAKIDEDRPDFFILDDVDDVEDSIKETESKLITITKKILPAGSPDVTILAVQNLILETGVFAHLIDNPQFLTNRILSGPIPALNNLVYEITSDGAIIKQGNPTWNYMSLERCQQEVDKSGITAFLTEFQHDVNAGQSGLFKDVIFKYCNIEDVPDLVKVVTWCDPAVTDNDHSDAHGIQIDGVAEDGKIYRLYSWEQKASPVEVLTRAINMSIKYKSYHVGVETNQGGSLFEELYYRVLEDLKISDRIPFAEEKATVSTGNKVHRATVMLGAYERGEIIHVINDENTHEILEKALRRFPDKKPFDLVDASYWSFQDISAISPGIDVEIKREIPVRNSIGRMFERQRYNIFNNPTADGTMTRPSLRILK
jgi:phage terminase large subunit-like protein